MTDEEIEKALAICTNERGEFRERPCELCPYEKYSRNQQCGRRLKMNALNYINRLKAKNKELQDKNRRVLDWKRRQEKFNNEMIDRFDEELKKLKEQIRKDMAKEIFKLVESVKRGENGMCYRNSDCVIASKIKEKYGVEVDDE